MPVLATVQRIERELRSQGFEVGATLNLSRQTGPARRTPGAMNQIQREEPAGQQQGQIGDARLLVFHHPEITRQVLQQEPMAVINVPSAILVYEQSEGQTMVVYRDPEEALESDFDAQASDLGNKLRQAIDSALREETASAAERQRQQQQQQQQEQGQQPAAESTGERGT
jgi:uncharacterized protein (DUF302 family)